MVLMVKFRDTCASFPVSKIQLGRDLSPDIDFGPIMAHKIMKANGQVMYRTSVRSLTPGESASLVEKQACLDVDAQIKAKYGPPIAEADVKNDPDFADFATPDFAPYEDDKIATSQMPDIDDVDDVDTYEQYVGAQFRFPIGDEIRSGKVMWSKCSLDGTVKGHANAMLDTRKYEVEFPDGRSDQYTANVIAKNMCAQCDEAGNQFKLMDCFVDHKTYGNTVDRADIYIKHGRNRKVRKTTKGWHLCVGCRYGTTSWERLADLKESNPVEVADYDVSNHLHDVPVFVW
jgi:hypothetical protein